MLAIDDIIKQPGDLQEAGGDEKALGSNAEARARALAVAVDKDPQYRAALDAVHEAYLRKVAADAVAEAAKEYLAVLKAALREV
jgi:hypothetical protein